MSRVPPPPPILETERLRLSPLEPGDARSVFPMMSDPEVMAYWDSSEIDDPDLVADMVANQVADMAAGRALYWALRSRAFNEFLGVFDLSEIDRRRKSAEAGFMLGREAWGQGFALEAMEAVIAHAAGAGFRKLTARARLGNRRSEGLLETLGFREEGLLRGYVMKDGERRDCRLFGLEL